MNARSTLACVASLVVFAACMTANGRQPEPALTDIGRDDVPLAAWFDQTSSPRAILLLSPV